jgi:hypothetical protein
VDEQRNRLIGALRDIAREDAAVSLQPGAALLAEFRAGYRARRRSGAAHAIGLAMAASLAVLIGTSLWLAVRRPANVSDPRLTSTPLGEVTTAFLPLPYGAVPYTSAQIVRLAVPRASMIPFGLITADAAPYIETQTVVAEVLVGEDGLARAVRFVRPAQAPAP